MSIGVSISTRDEISPLLINLGEGLRPQKVNPIIGRSARNTYREHLFGLDASRPNRLGGRRTNYYAGAARGTNFQATEGGVVVSIEQRGIRQRFYGGTIKPKRAKFLTIPVHPAAHGKTAGEFDLEVVFGAGGRPIALATKNTLRREIRQTRTGRIRSRNVGRVGEIYFLLVKSVNQKADPTVLPYPELVLTRIERELVSYTELLASRRKGPAS